MHHIDHLSRHISDLRERRILDLGSGRGHFLVDAVRAGFRIEGLEYNPKYIAAADVYAKTVGVEVVITQGAGEALPYANNSFGFINMAEVIEHVQDPEQVMREVYRVLKPGGFGYVSVPHRFGMRDPHFHLYGINWMPRSWTDFCLSLLKRHKEYTDNAGAQKLTEMHYFTYTHIYQSLTSIGFKVEDIRKKRIVNSYTLPLRLLLLPIYYLLRPWYFHTMHLLIHKPLSALR